jgi:DNA-binding MurR/RpiR family transcriptional regulator
MIEERVRKKYQFLTKAEKKVGDFFLAQSAEAAFLPISAISRRVKTSEATIFRFSRSIGYKGYPELQKELQIRIKQKISPTGVLRQVIAMGNEDNIYSKIFERDGQNIDLTREKNSNEILDRAVKEIIQAGRIGVTGFRSSYGMAYLLSFFLGQVRKNCELLEMNLGPLPNQLIHYGPKDMMIGISFPRYAASTLKILKYGKKVGCKIIALTDNPISPIGQIADIVLVSGHKCLTSFNSFTGMGVLINCLVAGVSLKSKSSVGVLKSVDQIVEDWEFLLM